MSCTNTLSAQVSAQVRRGELHALASCVGDRDTAIRSGLVIEGQRFEVRQSGLHNAFSLYCECMKNVVPPLASPG